MRPSYFVELGEETSQTIPKMLSNKVLDSQGKQIKKLMFSSARPTKEESKSKSLVFLS